MRSFNTVVFSAILLILTSFTSAWPYPPYYALARRQDGGSSQTQSSQASATKTAEGSDTITAAPSGTGSASPSESNGSTGSGTDSATGSSGDSGSGSGSATGTRKSGSSTRGPRSTIIDNRLPAGGVNLMTPAAISGPQYYKIGDQVTFAWNYTSLSVTPSNIDIVASCSANNQAYTIAANQSIGETSVTWDTAPYASETIPLLTETYTLVIYDAAKGVSATAQAGYLGTFNSYRFGMYQKQEYTPLNEFICATCSSALSQMERQALGFLFSMSIITVLSFTWFVGGAGLI